MAEVERQLRLLRFENFEIDLRTGELRRAGVKLKFGGQPFQILSILLQHPGEVVTRDELQKRLWPDTFVDVDHNLNTAINKIREVLGDSAENPRFVETLPRDRLEIYVANVAERKPRKLVTNITNVMRPHWSSDGKWIYFISSGSGRAGVYRCPATGGDAVLFAKDPHAINPRESLDGKTLYFASNHDKSTLKKVALPAQPDTESMVDGMPRIREAELWTLSRAGIYFVPDDAPSFSPLL